jgi:hypothetical protein
MDYEVLFVFCCDRLQNEMKTNREKPWFRDGEVEEDENGP